MQSAVAVFLISLGLGQLIANFGGLWAASLAGSRRWAGYILGVALLIVGGLILPRSFYVLWWTPPMAILAFLVLLWGGAFIAPIPHPDELFTPQHSAHDHIQSVKIPDGDNLIPGLLLSPKAKNATEAAALIVPGAGDNKLSFKWRLVQPLIAQGLTVLIIDLPGHGDYRHYPLSFPDCLSTVPAALKFLKSQPGVSRIGLVGISLGGAVSIRSLVEQGEPFQDLIQAMVIIATPIRFSYSRTLVYRELWRTYFGSPAVSLLKEMTIKQAWQSWSKGGYRSSHTTGELFDLLAPAKYIGRFQKMPVLLVYSRRDAVSPPEHAAAMRQAVPHADFLESKKASHIMLTLIPEINEQIAQWLKKQLVG